MQTTISVHQPLADVTARFQAIAGAARISASEMTKAAGIFKAYRAEAKTSPRVRKIREKRESEISGAGGSVTLRILSREEVNATDYQSGQWAGPFRVL